MTKKTRAPQAKTFLTIHSTILLEDTFQEPTHKLRNLYIWNGGTVLIGCDAAKISIKMTSSSWDQLNAHRKVYVQHRTSRDRTRSLTVFSTTNLYSSIALTNK